MPASDPFIDDVTIVPADQSLLRKVGSANLDRMFSNEAIQRAEKTITLATDSFYEDCVAEARKLQEITVRLRQSLSAVQPSMHALIATAFAIKTKAGQAGYSLVAALAKSLHLSCEDVKDAQVPASTLAIIDWHVKSIVALLEAKTKGDGGDIGKAILAEIAKLGKS